MDTIIKATAIVLIALMLYLTLTKFEKDFSLLLTITVCCMVSISAMEYLSPVIRFFETLQDMASLDPELVKIILKSIGISLLSEMACMICVDSGNSALGKSLQLLATAVILWISIPLFTSLIELIENILVTV